jgi:uncharacterized alkaline shock family protein YloU
MIQEVEATMSKDDESRYGGQEMEAAGHEDVVRVSDDVISTIASTALAEVKGVAVSPTSLVGGLLGRRGAARSIKVESDGNEVTLDITILVEYGARIPIVAAEIQRKLRGAIEEMTGKFVRAVNVTVQGVRLPSGSGGGEVIEEPDDEAPEPAPEHNEKR